VAAAVIAAVAAAAAGADTDPQRQSIHGGVRVNRAPPLFFLLMKEDHIEVEGCVKVILPGTMFRVELDNKHLVLATVCGKMRKRWVRLTVGDRVKMEMSPYDLAKARITWRLR